MARLDEAEVREIAERLDEEGFVRCEAFPVERWRKRGWPEDRPLFNLLDSMLLCMRRTREYRGD